MINTVVKYRWPIGIVSTLLVVIIVNFTFAWVALSDNYGAAGFERVDLDSAPTK